MIAFPSIALVKWGLVTHLRSKRSLLMLVAFTGIAMLGAAAFWPEGRFSQLASASQEMLTFTSMLFLCGALVFVPGLAAVTVTVEKERDTYDQLFLTLIRPSGIAWAKLTNVLGVYYLLIIGAMPVLGTIFFLVGVDWRQVLNMFCMVSATAFACAMGGIWCSAWFRKTMTSMLISYIVMICLTGAPLLLILAFFSFVSVRSRSIERLMEYSAQICSPVVQMVALNQPMAFGSATVAPYWAMAYQVACGMLFFILAWRIIRRPARPARVELRKPIDDPYVLAQRRRRFPYYLVDPLRRKKPIENRRNPMLVKELRWGFVGRTTWLIRVFYAVLTFYMFTGTYVAIHTNGTPGETIPFILVQMIVTILAIPPLLANSLSKEYEMGNMDFLRSTLLTPYEIVVGKVCAGVFNLAPLLLASAIAGVFMIGGLSAAGLFRDAYYLVTGYGSLGACVALSLGLGMFASLATKRTSTSLMLGYGLTILVYCGIALLALFLTLWLAPDLANQQGFGTAIAFLSPVSAYVASPEVYRAANNLPWTQASPLNPYWFANVVFFTGIGLGFLVLSVIRFKYHGMKET